MVCSNCKIKALCKYHEAFNIPGITLEVKDCAHIQPIAIKVDSITVDGQRFGKGGSEVALLNNKAETTSVVERKSRAFQDLSELSNLKRAEQEREKRKQLIESIKVDTNFQEGELETCPNCGIENTTTMNCPICEKKICSFCSVLAVDPNTHERSLICEECWENDNAKEDIPVEEKSEEINKVCEEICLEVMDDDTTE